METIIEISTGIDRYESDDLMLDADPSVLNTIADQYDFGDEYPEDTWIQMLEIAEGKLSNILSPTLGDWDTACAEAFENLQH